MSEEKRETDAKLEGKKRSLIVEESEQEAIIRNLIQLREARKSFDPVPFLIAHKRMNEK